MKRALPAIVLLLSCVISNVGAASESYRQAQLDAAPVFESAIQSAKEVTLLVFDPHSRFKEKKPGDRFFETPEISGSWLIVKEVTIKDQATQGLLGTSLRSGIEQFDGGVPDCFEPRHGIRVQIDGKEVTFIICFQCSQAYPLGYPKCSGFLVHPKSGLIWEGVFRDCGLKTIQ
jgi:hypothetical protein